MPGRTTEDDMPVYKDTVVIGNGPSAISLSYMLSGNVAFYKGPSDDDMLHNRMNYLKSTPIVLQDLRELSQVGTNFVTSFRFSVEEESKDNKT